MANPVITDTPGMAAAQANFEAAYEQVTSAFNMMSGYQNDLAAAWQGETQSAFGAAIGKWLDDFSVVQAQLGKMLDTLGANKNVYDSTNAQAQDMANWLNGRLTGVPPLPSF